MKIGLDFDGVIINCGRLKSLGAQILFGIKIPSGEFKKELVIPQNLLSPEQYKEVQEFVFGNSAISSKMEEVPDATTSIRKLQEKNTVIVVTSRDGKYADGAREWVQKNKLDLHIIGVPYGESKKEGATHCDVFIDDDIEKLEQLIGYVPNLFLFSWPYNRDIQLPPEITRVENWNDLLEKISALN